MASVCSMKAGERQETGRTQIWTRLRAQPADQVGTGKPMDQLRVVIVDDSQLVRSFIRSLLSSCAECTVCGEAADGAEGILKAAELRPDVILVDVSLPDKSRLEIVPDLRRELPQTRILVMSAEDRAMVLPRAQETGADGCRDKARLADLLPALGRPSS